MYDFLTQPPPERRTQGHTAGQNRHRAINSDSEPSYKADDEHVSPEARSRRNYWFFLMVILSILPFFALLIITGELNESLAWFTRGEVRRLTRHQRGVIKFMLASEAIICTGLITGLIVYFATRDRIPYSWCEEHAWSLSVLSRTLHFGNIPHQWRIRTPRIIPKIWRDDWLKFLIWEALDLHKSFLGLYVYSAKRDTGRLALFFWMPYAP